MRMPYVCLLYRLCQRCTNDINVFNVNDARMVTLKYRRYTANCSKYPWCIMMPCSKKSYNLLSSAGQWRRNSLCTDSMAAQLRIKARRLAGRSEKMQKDGLQCSGVNESWRSKKERSSKSRFLMFCTCFSVCAGFSVMQCHPFHRHHPQPQQQHHDELLLHNQQQLQHQQCNIISSSITLRLKLGFCSTNVNIRIRATLPKRTQFYE